MGVSGVRTASLSAIERLERVSLTKGGTEGGTEGGTHEEGGGAGEANARGGGGGQQHPY